MRNFPQNRLMELIKEKEKLGFQFNPNRSFYMSIGIRQKRFGAIIRNEKSPTTDELQKLSTFFSIPFSKLIESVKPINTK